MISTNTNGKPTITMTKAELGIMMLQFQNATIEAILHNLQVGKQEIHMPDAEKFINDRLLKTISG